MTRHIHADLIHAWAEGAEIESRRSWGQFGWTTTKNPEWDAAGMEFRIKPEEPEWYENIHEHGILVKSIHNNSMFLFYKKPPTPESFMPLTNEEIERFKR